jgi:CSLREA domain-containing protein
VLLAGGNVAFAATTFTVTSTADPGDGLCTAATTGDGCTLREAIAAANSSAGDDIVVFAPGLTGPIQLTTALPNLSTNIALQGPGANVLTVRGEGIADPYPVFHVSNGTATGPTVTTVSISGLTITNGDGGILNERGALTVSNCTFTGNVANSGKGGAICNVGTDKNATLVVQNSTFSRNSAESGGAICNLVDPSTSVGTATVTVQNSTFINNTANAGGGIANLAHGGGATVHVKNSTFAGNNANSAGGAILNNYTSGLATTYVGNTIFQAGSHASIGNTGGDSNSTVTSQGYNISDDDGSGFLNTASDQILTDPKLDPAGLQNNGGPTQTIALQSTSPAFNAGDPSFTPPPSFDQRGTGFNRVDRGRLDIGAFELQDPAQSGANLIVNTIVDHDDGVCGTDDCTLREAINAANAASSSDIISFAANVTPAITLTLGELKITKAMTVMGPGARVLAVDANLASRVLEITTSGGAVTVSGLTLTRGQSGGSVAIGGGILAASDVTLTDCTISDSSVIGDAVVGSSGTDAFGGGIWNDGTLTLVGCTVNGNSAFGGSFSPTGNSVDTGGTAHGGGIYNVGTLTLQNCTFTANTAQGGRGGHNPLLGSGHGGNGGNGLGGAIKDSFELTVINCTFSGNFAFYGPGGGGKTKGMDGAGHGGGIYRLNASNNHVGNTIIGGNTATTDGPDVSGSFTSNGFNFIGIVDATGTGFPVQGDQTGMGPAGIDPNLGSLADKGGPTDTMALLAGSNAINAGNDVSAPLRDQRGYARSGVSDIGAFEFNGHPLRITNLARNGNNLDVTFTVVKTESYRLERKLALPDQNWQTISGVPDVTATATGSGHITDTSSPFSMGKAFYRIRLLP